MFNFNTPEYIAVQLESGYGTSSRRQWLPLPATKKQFESAVKYVDEDGIGFNIVKVRGKFPGLLVKMTEEASLAQIKHLAAQIRKLDREQTLKLCAIHETDELFQTIGQLIDFTYNSERYTLESDILNEEDLGLARLQEVADYNVHLKFANSDCVDPFTFGVNIAKKEKGIFTSLGYLTSKKSWGYTPKPRHIPTEWNLKGQYGEDLYLEEEIE